MNYDDERIRNTGDNREDYDDGADEQNAYRRRSSAPNYQNRPLGANAYRNAATHSHSAGGSEPHRSMSYDEYMAEHASDERPYDSRSRIYDDERHSTRRASSYDDEYDGERHSTRRASSYDDEYDGERRNTRRASSYDDEYDGERVQPRRSRSDYGYTGGTAARGAGSGTYYSSRERGERSYTRTGSAQHAGYSASRRHSSGRPGPQRSGGRGGMYAALALIAVALIVIVPLAIRGNLFGSQPDSQSSGAPGLIPSPEVPFEDVFASPTPGTEPTAIPTQAPTEAPTEVPGRVLDPNKKAIALTFDDGPSKYTRRILETLAEVDGRATFFVVGERLDDYSETLKMVYDSGSQIGMHTYNHKKLTKLSADDIQDELDSTNDLIVKYTGEKSHLLRPPYGSVNSTVKETVNEYIINWSVDTLDWKSRDADSVYSEIMNTVQDGDIILMHDLYDSTAEAVSRVVPELVAQGYQLCTVDELFELKGIELQSGTVFRSARPTRD
ncbi:MAG: polysaccharide deacetylase family protein [Candidatus Fimadaptatus sp.]|jgi:peptidoglycan/xylan/chitin deacetylase (PgdA/CDA1 family)